MSTFIDTAEIEVQSGTGGNGMIHFRKEKFVSKGGPDGGDGGRGGDVIFRVDPHLNTLFPFRNRKYFKAEDGKHGGTSKKTGASAGDLIIPVPAGTLIYEAETERLLGDLTEIGEELVICKGGRGGRGNTHFRNSRNQAPRLAEKGEPGETRNVRLEL